MCCRFHSSVGRDGRQTIGAVRSDITSLCLLVSAISNQVMSSTTSIKQLYVVNVMFLFWELGRFPLLAGVALPLKDQVFNLEVLFDPSFSLEAQVTSVGRAAFYLLKLVCQLQLFQI